MEINHMKPDELAPSKLYTVAEEKLASQVEAEKEIPDPDEEEAEKVIASNIIQDEDGED
jgi:hypothetical protein